MWREKSSIYAGQFYAATLNFPWQEQVIAGGEGALLVLGMGVESPGGRFIRNIRGVKLPSRINFGQQGKHLLGGKNYISGRSILETDAQTLLDGVKSSKYTILRKNQNNIIVDFNENIGTFYQNGKAVGPTKYGTVHYGKNGAHIVPANPIQY
jgi:filamentous hemagglutinin